MGIATRYGQDGPGIESQLWRDFPYLSRLSLAPTNLLWIKRLGGGIGHQPPTSADVKERVVYI